MPDDDWKDKGAKAYREYYRLGQVRCHSDRDGECDWSECPQKTKRESYCRLAKEDEAEE